MYPDDSIQHYVDPWWIPEPATSVQRGHLVKALVPYFGRELRRLVVEGRTEARVHDRALFRVEPFALDRPLPPAGLPVAGMPRAPGEEYLAVLAKRRPAIVLSTGGPDLPEAMRRGLPRRHTAPSLLLAPYFSVDPDGVRAGFKPEFVTRVRRAEYPHFCWDKLPIRGGDGGSLLRLDYTFPVPKEPTAVALQPYRLSDEALAIVDDWLAWLYSGTLDGDSDLAFIREGLPAAD